MTPENTETVRRRGLFGHFGSNSGGDTRSVETNIRFDSSPINSVRIAEYDDLCSTAEPAQPEKPLTGGTPIYVSGGPVAWGRQAWLSNFARRVSAVVPWM